MILELMPYGDYHGLLSNSNVDVSWVYRFKVLIDTAKGLHYLHRRKPSLAHLDLKAMNIMLLNLDENEQVLAKLGDFGTSHSVPPSKIRRRYVENPTWLAPEIVNGLPYDEKVDIFGFGCVMYESATRQLMWHHVPWVAEIEDSIASGVTPCREELPADYSEIVAACWEFAPEKRPSAQSIIKQLTNILKKDDFQQKYPVTPRPKARASISMTEPPLSIPPMGGGLLASVSEGSEFHIAVDTSAVPKSHTEAPISPRKAKSMGNLGLNKGKSGDSGKNSPTGARDRGATVSDKTSDKTAHKDKSPRPTFHKELQSPPALPAGISKKSDKLTSTSPSDDEGGSGSPRSPKKNPATKTDKKESRKSVGFLKLEGKDKDKDKK